MNVSNTINQLAQANSTDHCDQQQQECTRSPYQDTPAMDIVIHIHKCKRNKIIKNLSEQVKLNYKSKIGTFLNVKTLGNLIHF